MYGLFRFSYDYHQFEHLCSVSARKEALEERYEAIKSLTKWCRPLVAAEKHDEFAENEEAHYCILPVEELK